MKPMDVVSSTTKVEDAEIDQESGKRLLEDTAPAATPAAPDSRSQAIKLAFCFIGLQVSYLTWGVMQEKIMTTRMEPTPLVPDGMFPSATFCVFSNRFLAIIVAAVICMQMYGTVATPAPLWYYTPCALSNTLSSWGQYAALKYVSFPLQVLFKSAKVIPVMIMGKVLNNSKYAWIEYIEAIVITVGVTLFSLAKDKSPHASAAAAIGGSDTSDADLYGLACLVLYICSDAFTSQWQDRINKNYETSTYQMMFGVNCSAIIITISALVLQNELPAVIEFMRANPSAIWNNVITAVTSATGQMFIFYTIKSFGPVVFTIIMTTRQMISMVISTMLFGHTITFGSLCGAGLVFLSLFYHVYRKKTEKKGKRLAGKTSESELTGPGASQGKAKATPKS